MTETTHTIDQLPPAIRRFVLQWGDMGSQWGVNRSIAQIHALLYVTERPMNAEEISDMLGIARSNVSNSLKSLLEWKIIQKEPIPGDRRDHFTAVTDVWTMAMRIAAVRKAKEIDPALETLTLCMDEAEGDPRVSREQRARIEAMLEFTGTMDKFYGQMLKLPTQTLWRLVKMGDAIVAMMGLGKRRKEGGGSGPDGGPHTGADDGGGDGPGPSNDPLLIDHKPF